MNMVFDYSTQSSWYKGVYQDKKAPVKAGRSFSLIHKDSKSTTAVLCIHGYTGYPGELVRPARELYEKGFDIFVPRLPGHGTSGKDFLKTGGKDWVSVAINAAEDLANRYERLYVLGHSMGGGIASIVASKVKGVKKLVLAAPALAMDAKELPAKPSMIHFISFFCHRIKHKWHSNPDYVMYYEDAPSDDAYLGSEYWSWLYPKELYHLFKIMIYAGREALPNITCPTLVLCSMKDSVLGTAASELALKCLGGDKKIIRLENGTHYLFYDIDKKEEDKAVNGVVEFFD